MLKRAVAVVRDLRSVLLAHERRYLDDRAQGVLHGRDGAWAALEADTRLKIKNAYRIDVGPNVSVQSVSPAKQAHSITPFGIAKSLSSQDHIIKDTVISIIKETTTSAPHPVSLMVRYDCISVSGYVCLHL